MLWRALKPRYDFRDRTVLITGGSRGLGLVIARQLAAKGARLGLMARDQDELDQAAFELRSHGTRVSVTAGDLKDREDVRRFVGESRSALGPIDVLINDAGVIGVGPLDEMTEVDFDLAMRTHFWGALYTTLEVLPEMKTRELSTEEFGDLRRRALEASPSAIPADEAAKHIADRERLDAEDAVADRERHVLFDEQFILVDDLGAPGDVVRAAELKH